MICRERNRKSVHPLIEPLNLLFCEVDKFNRDARFSYSNGEYIVARDLIIILLAIVEVLPEHRIQAHAGISFEKIQGIPFPMPYLITESICHIAMQDQIFIETFIGAEVESQTQSLEFITVNPVVPRSDHIVSDIQITGANKIQHVDISMKRGHFHERVHHFINRFFVLTQTFMPVLE